MKTAGIPAFGLLLLFLVSHAAKADGIFDYTDGETNGAAIVLTEFYNDFNMPAGSAVQDGPVSTASSGLFMGKYGAGTLTFSGVLDIDGYVYPEEGTMISSATGSFIDYLAVDNHDASLAAPVFEVSGGTLQVISLYVGTYGSGTVRVSDGLFDNSATATTFGYDAGATGTLIVAGPGSEFRSESIDLGIDGTGIATVSDGGSIVATAFSRRIMLGENAEGRGTLNIGAASGDPAAAAGLVDAVRVTGGAGGGEVVFNHTGVHYFTHNGLSGGQAVRIEGNVGLVVESGTTVLTGTNTYNGGTDIVGGRIIISDVGTNSVLGTGPVVVGENGALSGSGRIRGAATVAGLLEPGQSAGLMTFNGSLTLESTAQIVMELGGTAPADYDRFVIGGALVYGGVLNISFIDSFEPVVSDTFTLFSGFPGHSGTFAGIEFVEEGYEGSFDYATGTLTITVVPEPGVAALLGLGACAVGIAILRRRRRWKTDR